MVFRHREFKGRGVKSFESWDEGVVTDPTVRLAYGYDTPRKTRSYIEVEHTRELLVFGPEDESKRGKTETYRRRVLNATNEIRSLEDYEEIALRNAAIREDDQYKKERQAAKETAEFVALAGHILDLAADIEQSLSSAEDKETYKALIDFLRENVYITNLRRTRRERAAVITVAQAERDLAAARALIDDTVAELSA